jgi:hypothetical protein
VSVYVVWGVVRDAGSTRTTSVPSSFMLRNWKQKVASRYQQISCVRTFGWAQHDIVGRYCRGRNMVRDGGWQGVQRDKRAGVSCGRTFITADWIP